MNSKYVVIISYQFVVYTKWSKKISILKKGIWIESEKYANKLDIKKYGNYVVNNGDH